ncbi:unnamed protein product, partial [Ascophyllum nodosum]
WPGSIFVLKNRAIGLARCHGSVSWPALSKRRAIYPRTKEHGGKTTMAVVADGIEVDHLTHRRPTLPRTFPCSASRRRARAFNGHRVEEEMRTLHASKGGRWSWAAYRAC